jgi:hypothetical protein
MNPKYMLQAFALVFAIGTLVACGGSGGGFASFGGIGGTGITASGTITGFGSIFVNGIEFETDSAAISLDDNSGTESDLQLGMVVLVEGTLNADGTTATATSVRFDDEVQGPISNIVNGADGLSKTLTVLGIQVAVEKGNTVFDDVTFDTLAINDVVEVSGFVDNTGILHATRIEKKENFVAGASEIELKGVVSGLSGTTFSLGSFTVNFGGADLSGVPGGVIVNGMEVEVKGTLNGTTITASRVKEDDDLFDANEEKVSLEGIITDFISNANFKVSGQQVNASSAVFDPTNLVLGNGVEVEVEGPIVNGILQAIEVEARGGNVKIDATVLSVDSAGGTVTLQFVPGNVTVNVTNQTSLRDDLGVFDPFTLGNISAGNFLEIRGFVDGNGNIVADEIHRDTADDDILQGPADSCTAGSNVTIFGVSFLLIDGTTTFEDENDAPLANSTAFCNAVNASNFFVKVKDDQSSRDGIADEAELEN